MANPTVTLPGFKEAKRLQQSALAGAERRALVWMAERTPRWISSDDLSALGAFAMAEGGLAYWAAAWDRRWLFAVVAALALNWLGDSLDGTLHGSARSSGRATAFISITCSMPLGPRSCWAAWRSRATSAR